jgi:hypothetical protein
MNPWLYSKKIVSISERDINHLVLASISSLWANLCYVINIINIFFLFAHTHTHTFVKNKVTKNLSMLLLSLLNRTINQSTSERMKNETPSCHIEFCQISPLHMNDNDHKTNQKFYSPFLFVVILCIQAIEIAKVWKTSRPICMSFNLKKNLKGVNGIIGATLASFWDCFWWNIFLKKFKF